MSTRSPCDLIPIKTALAILALTGVSRLSGCGGQPCTLIGCTDSTKIRLLAGAVDVRGQTFVFRVNGSVVGQCEKAQCSEADPMLPPGLASVDSFVARFQGNRWVDLDYAQRKVISGSATLEIEVDGELRVKKTLELQSSSFSPNGEECGPTCRTTGGTFTLSDADTES